MKVFAGLALVGLIAGGFPPRAHAAVVEVKIEINAQCVSSIDPSKVVNSKKDVMLWSFVSICPDPQQVLVCAKGHPGATHAEPWKEQVGLPTSDRAKLGTKFKIIKGMPITATAQVLSSVNVPIASGGGTAVRDSYCVYVVNGSGSTQLQCPDKPCPPSPAPPTRGPELALEVDP